jgi:hypothetical protein
LEKEKTMSEASNSYVPGEKVSVRTLGGNLWFGVLESISGKFVVLKDARQVLDVGPGRTHKRVSPAVIERISLHIIDVMPYPEPKLGENDE